MAFDGGKGGSAAAGTTIATLGCDRGDCSPGLLRSRLLSALAALLTIVMVVASCDARGVSVGSGSTNGWIGPGGDPPAPAAKRFTTLPPGSALPSGATCAGRVRSSPWEPRPQNEVPNSTRGTGVRLTSIDSLTPEFAAAHAARIDGDFTGTTDEIIQWASCKWGFDEDITRARATTESWWWQHRVGDLTPDGVWCAQAGLPNPCFESHSLLQIKAKFHNPELFPAIVESTALGLDYALAYLRGCFEGEVDYLENGYGPGDEWACIGHWFSGEWRAPWSADYVAQVQRHLAERTWESSDFISK